MTSTCQTVRRPAAKAGPWATPCRSNGFTLIEVVMVMSIFSIGILAIMSLHMAAINSNAKARSILLGSTILTDRFEKLISADYAGIDPAPEGTFSQTAQGCRVEQAVFGTPIANIKRIDLTVSWEPSPGRSTTVTYYKRSPGW